MEKLTCRLLPFAVSDGAMNMAVDEALLQFASKGKAALRFYGWSVPTISLGYFQSASAREDDPLLASLPFVRRATGGHMLVHDRELTYALAMPAGIWQSGKSWPRMMHEIIAAALAAMGVECSLAADCKQCHETLCFLRQTPGDVTIKGHKIVGSAQRKQRGAILQHGGILLAQSPMTPTLPGVQELTGIDLDAATLAAEVTREFASAMPADLVGQPLTTQETHEIQVLLDAKYGTAWWNLKR